MNGEAKPHLKDNIVFEGGSLPLCSQCGLFPWWVLIGVIFSFPYSFLHIALGVDSSRLVIASATSRCYWLPMGLLCEIEYVGELLP